MWTLLVSKIFLTPPGQMLDTPLVKRSFPTLKRLKIYLRNNTGEERLTALALMTIHRDISVDKEKVVSQFSQSARRIRLF